MGSKEASQLVEPLFVSGLGGLWFETVSRLIACQNSVMIYKFPFKTSKDINSSFI
jgi:hypothetical protein